MTTKIYYFSGTGNSLTVARDLALNLNGDVKLVNIAQEIKKEKIEVNEDCVGIVYPIYFEGTPLIVSRFIDKISENNGTYFFGIATYGGTAAGAIKHLSDKFKSRGLKLSSGFVVKMPGNYTTKYDVESKESREKKFIKEKKKVKEIADIVSQKKKAPLETSNFIVNFLLTSIGYRVFSPKFPNQDRKYYVDDKCTGCGICEKICPVENIVLENGKPNWQHHCEQCFACFHWCPEKAIQHGSKTKKRERYHHPEVKLKDLINRK